MQVRLVTLFAPFYVFPCALARMSMHPYLDSNVAFQDATREFEDDGAAKAAGIVGFLIVAVVVYGMATS